EDVAVEEVAGTQVALEAVERLLVALAVRVVHGGEHVRGPGQLELHDGEAERGIALEDPGEDHVAHRLGGVEGLRGSAGRVAERPLAAPRILPCRRVAVCRLSGMARASAAAQNGSYSG